MTQLRFDLQLVVVGTRGKNRERIELEPSFINPKEKIMTLADAENVFLNFFMLTSSTSKFVGD